MTKPGSTATAVNGDLIGTVTLDSKEYQGVMHIDPDGHIHDSKPVYFYRIANQIHVAAASTIHWDLFNGDAALLVRILSIRQLPDIVTAVTGVAPNWTLQRPTAVGTSGTGQTVWLPDTSQAGLDADITCRSKPTGGATAGTQLSAYTIHSEETNTGTIMIASLGGMELIPVSLGSSGNGNDQGILLRPSQGISVTQTTSSSAGSTGWLIAFTVE